MCLIKQIFISIHSFWKHPNNPLSLSLCFEQLRYGDTGSVGENRRGLSTLSALHCEGDDLFENVVTFRYPDATVEIPKFNWAHSGDIYFQFKTTAENGILVHSKGYQDFIKVSQVVSQ